MTLLSSASRATSSEDKVRGRPMEILAVSSCEQSDLTNMALLTSRPWVISPFSLFQLFLYFCFLSFSFSFLSKETERKRKEAIFIFISFPEKNKRPSQLPELNRRLPDE